MRRSIRNDERRTVNGLIRVEYCESNLLECNVTLESTLLCEMERNEAVAIIDLT